jgi:hypothetical protein
MERHTFPVAFGSLVLLIAAISFPALRSRSNSSVLAASQSASPQQVRNVVETRAPDSCPVTKPPAHAFVPPSPYPTAICSDSPCPSFWFGTTKLWTNLPEEGKDGLRQKRLWWREGYDWHRDQEPALRITGVRLDSSDPPVVLSERANAGGVTGRNPPFIVDAFDVPAPGCWKMTARYKDGKLSFVVWVTQ